jgi:hypothetical protein
MRGAVVNLQTAKHRSWGANRLLRSHRLQELNKEFATERSNLIEAVLGEQSVRSDDRNHEGKNAHAVMNVLLRQFKEMEAGCGGGAAAGESNQKQRKQWLSAYHSLIRALPSSSERIPTNDRISMMENSTVLQMDELQTLKRRFVEAKHKFEQRHAALLNEKEAEIEQLEALIRGKQQSLHSMEDTVRELMGRLDEAVGVV